MGQPEGSMLNVGFPLFDICFINEEREILVCGGGGPSKSGVANGMVLIADG
jgi:hypothetical protein